MGPLTIGFGVLLIAIGIIGFAPHQSPTALIPAYLGIAFVVLGLLAGKENLRKHVMHLAALLGVLGFVAATGRIVVALLKESVEFSLALAMLILMALVCATFVGLCVKSFVDARRRRRQETL